MPELAPKSSPPRPVDREAAQVVSQALEFFCGRPLGEILKSIAHLTDEKLEEGLRAQQEKGGRLGEVLVGLKHVTDSKPTESWLGVPMLACDRVIGVISVESYKKNAFTNDDLILLTAIANQAAVAIRNA